MLRKKLAAGGSNAAAMDTSEEDPLPASRPRRKPLPHVVLENPKQEEEAEEEEEEGDTMKLNEEAVEFKEPSTYSVVSLNMDILVNPDNLKLVDHLVDQFKEKVVETGSRCFRLCIYLNYLYPFYDKYPVNLLFQDMSRA